MSRAPRVDSRPRPLRNETVGRPDNQRGCRRAGVSVGEPPPRTQGPWRCGLPATPEPESRCGGPAGWWFELGAQHPRLEPFSRFDSERGLILLHPTFVPAAPARVILGARRDWELRSMALVEAQRFHMR